MWFVAESGDLRSLQVALSIADNPRRLRMELSASETRSRRLILFSRRSRRCLVVTSVRFTLSKYFDNLPPSSLLSNSLSSSGPKMRPPMKLANAKACLFLRLPVVNLFTWQRPCELICSNSSAMRKLSSVIKFSLKSCCNLLE